MKVFTDIECADFRAQMLYDWLLFTAFTYMLVRDFFMFDCHAQMQVTGFFA